MFIKNNKIKFSRTLIIASVLLAIAFVANCFQSQDTYAYSVGDKLKVTSFDILCSKVRPSKSGTCAGISYKAKHSGHWLTVFTFRVRIEGKDYYSYGYCDTAGASNCTSDSKFHVETAKITAKSGSMCFKTKIEFDAKKGCQDIADGYITFCPEETAKFSGTTSKPKDKEIGCNTESTKVKFTHTAKRTDNNGGSAATRVKVKYKSKTKKYNGDWTEYSDWSDKTDIIKKTMKKGQSKNQADTITVKVAKPPKGQANKKRVCEKITYDEKVKFSGSDSFIEAIGDRASSDAECVTVTRSCGDGGCTDKYGDDETKWPLCGTPGADPKCCRGDDGTDPEPGTSELTAKLNQDLLFAGEGATSSLTLKVTPNETSDETETTGDEENSVTVRTEILPDSHDVTAIQFAIPDGADANDGFDATEAPGVTNAGGLYNFVNGRIGGIASSDGYLQINSRLSGIKATSERTVSGGTSSSAPDIIGGRSAVGGKYCVAALDVTYHNKRVTTTTVTTTEDEEGNKTTTRDVDVQEYHDLDPSLSVASNVECRPIAKKPYFQIENASTYGAGPIKTYATTTKNVNSTIKGGGSTRSFGSWTEYLLVGNNSIKNVTSGAALANGVIADPLTIANKSGLGYSNVGSSGFAEAITNYYNSGNGQSETTSGDSEISSINDFNNALVFISDDSITIGGDIRTDDGPFASNNNTTQHLIISTHGDINITDATGRIDAWLIAPEGNINTCDGAEPEECENPQLTINGLVAAKNINFERSYGMETPLGNAAAEKIVFSPALSYLWGYQQASKQTGQTGTVFIRELAPRQ